jgi:hypothetical protein
MTFRALQVSLGKGVEGIGRICGLLEGDEVHVLLTGTGSSLGRSGHVVQMLFRTQIKVEFGPQPMVVSIIDMFQLTEIDTPSSLPHHCYYYYFFLTGSHYAVKAGLKITM